MKKVRFFVNSGSPDCNTNISDCSHEVRAVLVDSHLVVDVSLDTDFKPFHGDYNTKTTVGYRAFKEACRRIDNPNISKVTINVN